MEKKDFTEGKTVNDENIDKKAEERKRAINSRVDTFHADLIQFPEEAGVRVWDGVFFTIPCNILTKEEWKLLKLLTDIQVFGDKAIVNSNVIRPSGIIGMFGKRYTIDSKDSMVPISDVDPFTRNAIILTNAKKIFGNNEKEKIIPGKQTCVESTSGIDDNTILNACKSTVEGVMICKENSSLSTCIAVAKKNNIWNEDETKMRELYIKIIGEDTEYDDNILVYLPSTSTAAKRAHMHIIKQMDESIEEIINISRQDTEMHESFVSSSKKIKNIIKDVTSNDNPMGDIIRNQKAQCVLGREVLKTPITNPLLLGTSHFDSLDDIMEVLNHPTYTKEEMLKTYPIRRFIPAEEQNNRRYPIFKEDNFSSTDRYSIIRFIYAADNPCIDMKKIFEVDIKDITQEEIDEKLSILLGYNSKSTKLEDEMKKNFGEILVTQSMNLNQKMFNDMHFDDDLLSGTIDIMLLEDYLLFMDNIFAHKFTDMTWDNGMTSYVMEKYADTKYLPRIQWLANARARIYALTESISSLYNPNAVKESFGVYYSTSPTEGEKKADTISKAKIISLVKCMTCMISPMLFQTVHAKNGELATSMDFSDYIVPSDIGCIAKTYRNRFLEKETAKLRNIVRNAKRHVKNGDGIESEEMEEEDENVPEKDLLNKVDDILYKMSTSQVLGKMGTDRFEQIITSIQSVIQKKLGDDNETFAKVAEKCSEKRNMAKFISVTDPPSIFGSNRIVCENMTMMQPYEDGLKEVITSKIFMDQNRGLDGLGIVMKIIALFLCNPFKLSNFIRDICQSIVKDITLPDNITYYVDSCPERATTSPHLSLKISKSSLLTARTYPLLPRAGFFTEIEGSEEKALITNDEYDILFEKLSNGEYRKTDNEVMCWICNSPYYIFTKEVSDDIVTLYYTSCCCYNIVRTFDKLYKMENNTNGDSITATENTLRTAQIAMNKEVQSKSMVKYPSVCLRMDESGLPRGQIHGGAYINHAEYPDYFKKQEEAKQRAQLNKMPYEEKPTNFKFGTGSSITIKNTIPSAISSSVHTLIHEESDSNEISKKQKDAEDKLIKSLTTIFGLKLSDIMADILRSNVGGIYSDKQSVDCLLDYMNLDDMLTRFIDSVENTEKLQRIALIKQHNQDINQQKIRCSRLLDLINLQSIQCRRSVNSGYKMFDENIARRNIVILYTTCVKTFKRKTDKFICEPLYIGGQRFEIRPYPDMFDAENDKETEQKQDNNNDDDGNNITCIMGGKKRQKKEKKETNAACPNKQQKKSLYPEVDSNELSAKLMGAILLAIIHGDHAKATDVSKKDISTLVTPYYIDIADKIVEARKDILGDKYYGEEERAIIKEFMLGRRPSDKTQKSMIEEENDAPSKKLHLSVLDQLSQEFFSHMSNFFKNISTATSQKTKIPACTMHSTGREYINGQISIRKAPVSIFVGQIDPVGTTDFIQSTSEFKLIEYMIHLSQRNSCAKTGLPLKHSLLVKGILPDNILGIPSLKTSFPVYDKENGILYPRTNDIKKYKENTGTEVPIGEIGPFSVPIVVPDYDKFSSYAQTNASDSYSKDFSKRLENHKQDRDAFIFYPLTEGDELRLAARLYEDYAISATRMDNPGVNIESESDVRNMRDEIARYIRYTMPLENPHNGIYKGKTLGVPKHMFNTVMDLLNNTLNRVVGSLNLGVFIPSRNQQEHHIFKGFPLHIDHKMEKSFYNNNTKTNTRNQEYNRRGRNTVFNKFAKEIYHIQFDAPQLSNEKEIKDIPVEDLKREIRRRFLLTKYMRSVEDVATAYLMITVSQLYGIEATTLIGVEKDIQVENELMWSGMLGCLRYMQTDMAAPKVVYVKDKKTNAKLFDEVREPHHKHRRFFLQYVAGYEKENLTRIISSTPTMEKSSYMIMSLVPRTKFTSAGQSVRLEMNPRGLHYSSFCLKFMENNGYMRHTLKKTPCDRENAISRCMKIKKAESDKRNIKTTKNTNKEHATGDDIKEETNFTIHNDFIPTDRPTPLTFVRIPRVFNNRKDIIDIKREYNGRKWFKKDIPIYNCTFKDIIFRLTSEEEKDRRLSDYQALLNYIRKHEKFTRFVDFVSEEMEDDISNEDAVGHGLYLDIKSRQDMCNDEGNIIIPSAAVKLSKDEILQKFSDCDIAIRIVCDKLKDTIFFNRYENMEEYVAEEWTRSNLMKLLSLSLLDNTCYTPHAEEWSSLLGNNFEGDEDYDEENTEGDDNAMEEDDENIDIDFYD